MKTRSSIRALLVLTLLATLATLAGCASKTSVRVLADSRVDMSSYKTFGYFDPLGTDRAEYATLVSEHLRNATTREMQARGYVYSASDPDLLINFSGKLEDKLRVTQTPTAGVGVGLGPRSAWSGGYYGYRTGFYSTYPMYETSVQEYQQGTLNVDLIDAEARQLVWEGIGARSLNRKTLDNIGPAIDPTVSAIFEKFPVPKR